MSQASLSRGPAGEVVLAGVLDYRTGAALLDEGTAIIRANTMEQVIVDCSAVEKSSSVGLSLLLAFARQARAKGKVFQVRGLPEEMRQIAQVCEVDGLLTPH